MASPDLVNMMAFIQKGQAFPKSLDPKGKKGIVSSESLVGYSRYTSRDDANDKEKQNLDVAPGGYYKYTNERKGSTRTFTNEGWIDSKSEMTKFRNYVASNFQEEGKLAWLPVQSYKDYATASQYGLFSEEDYAQITKNTLNRFFKHVDLEPSNMIWWMNYHNNKNHPHVHVAFLEKETTRERGQFTAGELKQFKRYMLTEMKERERLILGTENAFKENMKLLQSNKQLLQSKGKTIIANRQDKLINDSIQKLYTKLPTTGRLQYGSSQMIPYREEIDNIVDQVLQHELVKEEYENLLKEFTELDLVYQDKLGEKISNMKDSEVQKIRKVIANEILASKKKGKVYTEQKAEEKPTSDNDITDDTFQIEPDNVEEVQDKDEEFESLVTEDIEIIKETSDMNVSQSKKKLHMDWTLTYKNALKYLYGTKELKQDKLEAKKLLEIEANNLNVLAISDLAKVQASMEEDEQSFENYKKALDGFHKIIEETYSEVPKITIPLKNKKKGPSPEWTRSYANYRIGKHHLYGMGTEVNHELAIDFLKKAPENKYALYSLGTMYERGMGCEVEIDSAIKCYKKSSDLNNPYASYALAKLTEGFEFNNSPALYKKALDGFEAMLTNNSDDMLQYKVAKIILDEKVGAERVDDGLEYLKKSSKFGNEYAQCYLVKYFDKYGDNKIKEYAEVYRKKLIENKNQSMIRYEGMRLSKSNDFDELVESLNLLTSIDEHSEDKIVIYELSKVHEKLGNEIESLNYLEQSAKLENVYGTFKYAKTIMEIEPEKSQAYFLKSLNLMQEEMSVGRNTDFFMFRIAQMYENGWGLERNQKSALDIYRQLATRNHEYGSNKFISLTYKNKNYQDYQFMQQILRNRFNFGDIQSGTKLAYSYLDSENPNFDKDKGVAYLKSVYEKTGDENIKNSIDYYSNDYGSDDYQFNNAKGCINSALSAIKKSDAEVKKIVREGLEEYLETEKEREQKKYGKNI